MQPFLLHLFPWHSTGTSSVLSVQSTKSPTLGRVCKCFLNTNTHNHRRHGTLVQEGHVSSCKRKIRTSHKKTTGIALWPHWSSCIHPPSKQFFMVHIYHKQVARGRWCCNVNTTIGERTTQWHTFFLSCREMGFSRFSLSNREECNAVEEQGEHCCSRLAITKESRKRIWAQTEQQRGLAPALQHTREPHHYQPVRWLSLLEVFHQTISDQPSYCFPPKNLSKPITPA